MSDKVEVKRGTKIEPDEFKTIDPSKLAVLIARPPQDKVEGQFRYSDYTQCPWCGHIGWTNGLQTEFYVAVVCGACGQPFRA